MAHFERRWRAAVLTGLSPIQAIQLPRRPSDTDRLVFQYVENEARAALSDLDRAEAALRLKGQLEQEGCAIVPWAEVETRLNLSESWRIQLLRLYERLPVTTPCAPLSVAGANPSPPARRAAHTITVPQALPLLTDLEARTQRGEEITGTLVGKLVTDLQRQGYQGEAWLDEERERVQRMTTQGKLLLKHDLYQLSTEGRAALRRDLEQLQRVLMDVGRKLGGVTVTPPFIHFPPASPVYTTNWTS